MNNSNKEIAKRIIKELKVRDWGQTDLLKKIIKFKNPEITAKDLYIEIKKRKGNFSTTLKGKENRSFPKEDLYIISKIFGVPLEYIWYGDEKKSDFIPQGARYAAFQDSESEYRTYIANLEYEEKIQYPDDSGFNLFDYFGQYESINGYKFFLKNYGLHFDYIQYGELTFINDKGYLQTCSSSDKSTLASDNLIMVLAKNNDVKTFKAIFFSEQTLKRFDSGHYYHKKEFFSEYFLETLLKTKSFFESILKIREVDISNFNKNYEKMTKRIFVEPMFYEALNYALRHETDFKEQLTDMLSFALQYSREQYEFIKDYILEHIGKDEYGDVYIDQYEQRCLVTSRNIPMGNVIKIRETTSDESLNNLIKEIDQYIFNTTHIINAQEKRNEEIIISTPENQLFIELLNNAKDKKVAYIPLVLHLDNKFTYFQNYESASINYESPEHLSFILDCLNQAQSLVTSKPSKILVHGDLGNKKVLMVKNNNIIGIAGWQKCHYGDKYEDRAELLANLNIYSYSDDYLKKYEKIFEVISKGFVIEDKRKLIDKAIDILTKKRKIIDATDNINLAKICWLKEKASKLELFKELYLK